MSSSSHKLFAHCQRFRYAMGCSRDVSGVESLHWVSLRCSLYELGAGWWWQSSAVVLFWLWGGLIFCAEKGSGKDNSVLYFLFSQLCSGSGLCGYMCTMVGHGALLLFWQKHSLCNQQRFSSGQNFTFSSDFALKCGRFCSCVLLGDAYGKADCKVCGYRFITEQLL